MNLEDSSGRRMRRVDGTGRCEHCGVTSPYEMVHNGFNDSAFAYCDRCGRVAIVDLVEIERRLGQVPALVTPLPEEVAEHLASCTCGGSFKGDAPARCPSCHKALSAELAAAWIEAQASGAKGGWRWQRSWPALYALILGERVVFNPWSRPPS